MPPPAWWAHSRTTAGNFGIFLDSSPDRWGQTLLKRREALQAKDEKRTPRTLYAWDFLIGVQDFTSYLALAQFLRSNGDGARAGADLEQLFRRVSFNVAVGNRDDHLRNHGFVLGTNGWQLAPAFDVNPNIALSRIDLTQGQSRR
ncbi:MAG: HipA domain-containing protein [Burkholderiales bacterium]|nr:HipA domain-containing protein [Burkholderiales bacterium]